MAATSGTACSQGKRSRSGEREGKYMIASAIVGNASGLAIHARNVSSG